MTPPVERPLPELSLEPWELTKDTLHLDAQIVGKVRLACAPPRNHWWHSTLYLDARGLTTYIAPDRPGLAETRPRSAGAFWSPANGSHMALLWYEEARPAPRSRETLLDFMESAYQAGALAAGWDRRELASNWCPSERLATVGPGSREA